MITDNIRRRDKDTCHWCKEPVNFENRHGGKAGCFDFIDNSEKSRATEENTVVSCRHCEQERREPVAA